MVGAGLGATTALAITAETASQLAAPGGWATFGGSLTGLVGTYLALVMVLLVSRIPFVERVLGQDGLLRWHRWLAPWPIGLLITHALFITIGYARAARTGVWHQVGVLITQYPDILTATVALGLMCVAGAISIRTVRRRLPRERWWVVHLYLYLALAISFAHVIVLGPSFVGHPLTQPSGRRRGWPPRGWCCATGSGCRCCAASGTGCGLSRCAGRPGCHLGYRQRPPPRPAGCLRRPVLLLAVPHPGHVVAGHPTRSRPCRVRRTCG